MKDCRGRKGKLYYDELEYMKFKISKGQRFPYDYFIAKRLICLPGVVVCRSILSTLSFDMIMFCLTGTT